MALTLVNLCCVFSTLGSFLSGYGSGIIDSSFNQIRSDSRLEDSFGDHSSEGIFLSFTGLVMLGGAIVGSAGVSYLSDTYGRKTAIFVGGILAVIGGTLQTGAVAVAMLIAGRFIAGLAIGILSATIPVYCCEIAPARIRGFLAGMQHWMMGLGFLVANWVGYGFSHTSGPVSWRFSLSLQVAAAILLTAGALALPESPRWLIEHERSTEGREVLQRLLTTNSCSNDQQTIDIEFHRIQTAISQEQSPAVRSWSELLRRPTWRRRILLGSAIQVLTQCSGLNVVTYYRLSIYNALNLPTSHYLMISGISGALELAWNTLCLFAVDRIGRRKLLIPSLVGMGATLCAEAILSSFFRPAKTNNDHALRAQIAMYFVFRFFFTALGMISFVYPAEILPTVIRARGTSISTCVNWCLDLIFAQCSQIALWRLGYKYFHLFVAFNWIGAVIVWAYFPETTGRTLEEIEEVFEGKKANGGLPLAEVATEAANGSGLVYELGCASE